MKATYNLGSTLKKFRKQKGFSQEKLAQLAELKYTTYTKIESNKIQQPSVFTVFKLCKVLEISVEKLISASNYSTIKQE